MKNNSTSFSLEAEVNFGGSILEDFALEVDLAKLAHIASVSILVVEIVFTFVMYEL